jgi:predicted nucleic acid-binding protein
MGLLYREVRAGTLSAAEGRRLLERLAGQRVRLLGDRGSRSVAWRIATELGWEDTARAEYVAVAQLQADALVTADPALATAVAGIVRIAPYEVLLERER